jgi:hypothetical protein
MLEVFMRTANKIVSMEYSVLDYPVVRYLIIIGMI